MSDPAEIYLQPECCADPYSAQGRLWCEHDAPVDCEDGVPWTKYVIADRVRELEAALCQCRMVVSGYAEEMRNLRIDDLRRDNERLRAGINQAIVALQVGMPEYDAGDALQMLQAALAQGEKPC